MYEELISKLREVFPEIDCNHCPVNRNCLELKGVCTFEKAADAFEEMSYKYQKALSDLVKHGKMSKEENLMAKHKDYAILRSDYSTNTTLTIVRTEDGDVCLRVSGDGEMRIAMSGSRLLPEDRLRVLKAFQNLIDVIPVIKEET